MSFLERVKDLISANINDALDKAEDPEKMAREYLRQLNDQVYEAKTQLAEAMADETRLQQKMLAARSEVEQWNRHAENALREGKEDLAKQALQRKLHARKLAEQYDEQFTTQDAYVDDLEDALAILEARISETQARRDLIVAKKNRMQTMQAIQSAAKRVGQASALDKFDQLEDNVDRQLAEVEAMAELNAGSLEAAFQQLESDTAVDTELQELKRKMGL